MDLLGLYQREQVALVEIGGIKRKGHFGFPVPVFSSTQTNKMRLSSLILLAVSVYTANVNSWPLFSLTDPSIEIKNVLSHYCIILDTKTYSDLSQIYTSDAVANFSTIGLGVLSGLPAIESAMNASLFGIPTQHAMTTSYISGVDSHSANATT